MIASMCLCGALFPARCATASATLTLIAAWEDSQWAASLWNPPSVFVFVKHSRVSGITSLFLSSPVPLPCSPQRNSCSISWHTQVCVHACMHVRMGPNWIFLQCPFFSPSFSSAKVNTGRVLPCHFESIQGCLRCCNFSTFSHPSDLYWSG